MNVRVGIVDSGVYAGNPLVGAIAGGVAIVGEDLSDQLGHGTAVAANIRQNAPAADLYVVKIFDRSLACPLMTLLRGIEWCLEHHMHFVNLSLGTANAKHEPQLRALVDRATALGVVIVAPAGSLPGDLEGVVRVIGTARAGSLEGSSFAVAAETGRLAASFNLT